MSDSDDWEWNQGRNEGLEVAARICRELAEQVRTDSEKRALRRAAAQVERNKRQTPGARYNHA